MASVGFVGAVPRRNLGDQIFKCMPRRRHPLSVVQYMARGGADEDIRMRTDVSAHTIHRVGHFVTCAARDVLGQGGANNLTARFARAPCQPFDLLE